MNTPSTPGDLTSLVLMTPVRIFFSQGMSPNMNAPDALGESDTLNSIPYRARRKMQSQDEDYANEIIDATDDPAVIAACSVAESSDTLSLCETNGYENAVRSTAFQTNQIA